MYSKEIIPATKQNLSKYKFKNPVFTSKEIEKFKDIMSDCERFVYHYNIEKLNGFILNELDVELMKTLGHNKNIQKCVVKSKVDKPNKNIFETYILVEGFGIEKPFTFMVKRIL